jgi:hypothetical protein
MKPVDLVSVCVRFFAVSLVLSALSFMFQMVDVTRGLSPFAIAPSPLPVFLFGGVIVLFLLTVALVFWLFPIRIARFIVPKGIEGEFNVNFTAEELEVFLLSLLGVWVLIEAVPQLGQLAVWITRVKIANEDATRGLETLVLRLVQIAIGVLLLLKSVGIRRIVNDLRTKGT